MLKFLKNMILFLFAWCLVAMAVVVLIGVTS